MKIGIIGTGIAGLASAVRMASKGYEVDVFEANAYPGGKLSEIRLGEYRFDAGPSLFTMPQYVEELFEVAGAKAIDHFQYERLSVICHYFWEDGTQLKAHAKAKDFGQAVEETFGVPAKKIQSILSDSEKKYQLTGRIFLEKSLHKAKTWLSTDVARALLQIPGMDLFTTMDQVNRKYLGHPKMVQLFNRFATYNGSNPYKVPGLLSIIPHFEHKIGAFFPSGGMYAITKSVFELAKDKGVVFHFNAPVEEIMVKESRATGIRVKNKVKSYDRIISNMDIFHTYRQLLPNEKHPERILRQEKSTSALIFYWGIKEQFSKLGLHNIFFSDQYETEFEHLDQGQVYEDPTVYINITQKHCPDDAPEGCENWFTMINVPYNSGQDWDRIIEKARQNIQTKLSRILGKDIKELIECEAILDPRTIEQRTTSHLGALYGTSSNDRMAAFLRHPNFSRKIKDLYFCGGSVHPGGGIPLCLLSAKIVAELIAE